MSDTTSDIDAGLSAMGIAHGASDAESMARHLGMVAEANAHFNLTTISEEDSVALHVLDSASALAALAEAPKGDFADLGSGAGFPGIPLALLSRRPVTLVESVKKKAAFLEAVVAELRLEASVQGIRAEELAQARAGCYAAVTARALSALPSLVELASPLLTDGGLLICLKGDPDETELIRGASAARRCGMESRGTTVVAVPGVDARRTIVVYRRTGGVGILLPRRNGMAQRQPLA